MGLYMELKNKIHANIEHAFYLAKENKQLDFEELPQFVLEVPREKSHGDLATNAALLLAKQAKKAPREIAGILLQNLNREGTWIAETEIAGPGFINFRLDPAWLMGVIPEVLSEKERYGSVNIGKGRKVQVEFVSANPTGLLHMGNARGAALGDSLASLLSMAGFDVTREFYINDAGNQIYNFALSLEARYFQLLGQAKEIPENGYHGEDIIETVREIIRRDGDVYLDQEEDVRREALVRFALKEKIEDIKKVLADFGVKYDIWFSEQSLHDSGAVAAVTDLLTAKGYTYRQDGALWLKGAVLGEEKDEVIIRGNGAFTYFAGDIAYHRNKFERGFDRIIDIWGADHHGHVARMKAAMKALGHDADSLQVILMQLVRLIQEGEVVKMSKRSGKYITLRELIDEVGKDAARFFFLMRDPDSTVDFDMDLAKAESSENPVYYVQYAHARLCSILRNAKELGCKPEELLSAEQLALLKEPEAKELLKKIAELPDEVALAANLTEPHRLTWYISELAKLFHSFYHSCRVLIEDDTDLRTARIALVSATRQVLANVLGILGVTAPERM